MRKPLNKNTPRWFKDWLANDFWHLNFKVNILLWLTGGSAVAVVGKLVIDFWWG